MTASRLEDFISSKGMHRSHDLRVTGALVWCHSCGCYSQVRVVALKGVCRGKRSATAGQLAQLKLALHPLTGDSLGAPAARSAAAKSAARQSLASSSAKARTKAILKALSRPTYRALGEAFGKLV